MGLGKAWRERAGSRRGAGWGHAHSEGPRVLWGAGRSLLAGESAPGGRGGQAGKACTRGVGEPEGDGLVRDAAHVAYRHLAGVAGIVLGPQVLQLQDLGLPLGSSKALG